MGGEGACMTSRMFFGGWSYPDELDCAAMGRQVAQATSAPIQRHLRVFPTGISFLRCNITLRQVHFLAVEGSSGISSPALRRPSISCLISSESYHLAYSWRAAAAKSGRRASRSCRAFCASSRRPNWPSAAARIAWVKVARHVDTSYGLQYFGILALTVTVAASGEIKISRT